MYHSLNEIIKNIDCIPNHNWILDVSDMYIRRVNIGKFGICHIPYYEYENIFKECNNNIFLHTKYKDWLWLKNKKTFIIEVEGKIRKVWLCKIITFEQLLEECPKNQFSEKAIYEYSNRIESIPIVNIIYGRCINSMTFLDKVYRDYIYRHKFIKNQVVAIKSVAGSGKTTTLLELAKIHNNKKILYIAFNKSLITEIKEKIKLKNIKNLYPCTFDSLMRDVFIKKTGTTPDIIDIKPQTLSYVLPYFDKKPFKVKNYYARNYTAFCNQTKFNDINKFSRAILGIEKTLLKEMWQKTLNHEVLSFDSIRKLVEIDHLCKDYIDNKYDMIFIDESQDFDAIMLKILLEDTTIPKLFVGDTRQAIYEWRGCINAFDNLPSSSLVVEFYSTFRVGDPACSQIRDKFKDCWLITKSTNETILEYDVVPQEKYTYLFRNWKNLLKSASSIDKIWIYNFDTQIQYIKRLHEKLQFAKLTEEELNEFSDDLPQFLLKLSAKELESLINNIEKNMVQKNECMVEMYTIHSYKGLEDDVVRIFNDINIEKEINLYYVALTRGKKRIILDTKTPIFNDNSGNKEQMSMLNYGFNCIILD